MTRLIPGKTKVQIELFRGVTLGDVVIAAVAIAMLIFVIISSLPFKIPICIVVALVCALLLVRVDEQPNYVYFINILSHFGYHRRFARNNTDQMLADQSADNSQEIAFDQVFRQNREQGTERETREERKARERERAQRRKEEDKILKSDTASQEEKEAILARRRVEGEELLRKEADARDAATSRRSMDELMGFTGIEDHLIVYNKGEYFGAVIGIDPVEFRFFSEHRRTSSIEMGLGRVLRGISPKYSVNIVKLEQPIRYDSYLEKEYEKLLELRRSYESAMLTEEELRARVEVEYDRINQLRSLCGEEKVVTSFYYLVLFESDKRMLEVQVSNALNQLIQGEMAPHRLGDKELAIFLKYSNAIDFDEHEIDKLTPDQYVQWAQPEVVDIKARTVEVNHVVTHNLRVVNYPALVGDAWLAGVMSYPGTKVVVKARPMDRQRAIRNIDHSLTELRGQWSSTGVDSRRMELERHIQTLGELLSTLQNDNESLLEVNVYITAYDIVGTRKDPRIVQPGKSVLPTISDMKKSVRRAWQESGLRLGNMEFDQVRAFIGSQVSGWDPLANQGRGIPSNTLAACYPWIYAHISDPGGILLGENDGIPVFIDFFRRDSERVNSNMVIVGKSGSGKSFATKTILANLAADDAKVFVLDPENEYTELAGNLHGKIINVGNALHGRLNPFHIITALEDDEAGEEGPSGSYATHLQFLEEFFRQILPDCDKDSMEYLNNVVDRLYGDFGITGETDLSKLGPEDYPVFDDLYDAILQEFQSTDNQYIRTMLRTLMNYVAKFSTGGRNANIWNGPSTVTTDTNFTVFNFQSMLANRNTTIANAQMLLVLKYIDNEIIKNRDYNTRYKLNRKIVVVIDEAHVFIDTKFPIALDFMFQLAKRIRKYNGMQIVITQNIKDFVGSEEIARKSTAIINACQYSFIFSLAPNDIQDLVKLYENAGGINENEQEQIVQAPRGQAFTIMSPTSRSTFQVQTGDSVKGMFEEREYGSRYFFGPTGTQAWEDFVAGSRPAHEAAARVEEVFEQADREEDQDKQSILYDEVSREEYEESGEEDFSLPEDSTPTPTGRRAALPTLPPDAPAYQKETAGSAEAAIEKLANVLTQSLQRNPGVDAEFPAGEGGSGEPQEVQAMFSQFRHSMEEQFSQERKQLGDERAQLRQEREELSREREELRSMMEQLKGMSAGQLSAQGNAPESSVSAQAGGTPADNERPEAAAQVRDTVPAAPAPEKPAAGAGAAPVPESVARPSEIPVEATEPPTEATGAPEGEAESGGFDLNAYLAQSVAKVKKMTVIEKMRQDGKKVAPITMEDLDKCISSGRW